MGAEERFVAKNEAKWTALADFNTRLAKGGVKNLSPEELREFSRLFRLASFHMAYAKTHFPGGQTLLYLNNLVGIAHNYFYVRETGALSEIWAYLAHGFPKAVRETWRYSGLATALFFLGLLFAAFYVYIEPARAGDVLPGMFGNPEAIAENLGPPEDWDGTLMSAFFMTNNTRVAINAFVWGIFAGIGTLYVLVYNGLIVGALFGLLHGLNADMMMAYALILPHGVTELAAIFLSGGAGLMIGKGLLLPGIHSRKHSLILHTRKAVTLVPGIVILLTIAAVIEGFFTPLAGVTPEWKLVFAALTGLGLAGWILNPRGKNRKKRKA